LTNEVGKARSAPSNTFPIRVHATPLNNYTIIP
jgi:hypothetical protein